MTRLVISNTIRVLRQVEYGASPILDLPHVLPKPTAQH